MKNETRTNIRNVGSARDKIVLLEKKGIPQQHEDFTVLRDEIHLLLDHLLVEDKIDIETSHMIRLKLSRINDLFFEMEKDGNYDGHGSEEKLDFDKEKQDSKLHVVQLMLSQIFPKLKEAI